MPKEVASTTSPTVYLLRHGRTALNVAGALRGLIDVPLDAVGEAEAARLGDLFADVRLAVVGSSPLRRARETAERVAAATGAPLRIQPQLRDRDYGSWAGRPRAEAEQRYGSVDAAPGVEPAAIFEERVLAAFSDIVDGACGQIALVAHDAVNRALLRQLAPDLSDGAGGQRTGCWNWLERCGSGWSVRVLDGVPADGRRPLAGRARVQGPCEPTG